MANLREVEKILDSLDEQRLNRCNFEFHPPKFTDVEDLWVVSWLPSVLS